MWNRLLGHDAWVKSFREVVRRNRMAHAYLFVGPPGIGKRSFAIEFAKSILCENPPDLLTACDQCAACRLVDAQTHPDFFFVAKPEDENVLSIDTMRKLCGDFSLKTARGRGKVAILDDADDLNDQSANCFLKTLEEPPPRSVFILIGTTMEQQLATIRSRCQTVRFAPLQAAVVKQLLEKAELPDRSLIPRLVQLAEGSPGQALALADPVLWEFRNRLIAALTNARIETLELSKAFTEFAEDAGKETSLHRARVSLTLRLFLAALRDAVRLRLGKVEPEALDGEAQLIQTLARRVSPEHSVRMVDRVLEAEVQLNRYIPIGLILEGLVDAWAQILEK